MSTPDFDPEASDSPHITGIQPTARFLEFAAEVLRLRWQHPDTKWDTLAGRISDAGIGKSKVKRVPKFLNKIGCLDQDKSLTGSGAAIAETVRLGPQHTGNEASIGNKPYLTDAEQAMFRQQLFEHDWLPMLAVLNQVSVGDVTADFGGERADNFVDRLTHLTGYDESWGRGTKDTKSRVHFDWAERVGLIEETKTGTLELTPLGSATNTRLQHLHHPDWPQSPEQGELGDF
ncbi:hypothetical protein [Halobacterium bonnevillei]|uniref:Uncharacterized protein n=1 Tax=Halobacterium bonnevillei TaxID=2692200 RepID=A0A6B0SP42_9EURY|nr:hypothetical protein [Halobacterium bonnevillei]MXR21411.1 hypothetical protein [Halobacterium bonnevillei]